MLKTQTTTIAFYVNDFSLRFVGERRLGRRRPAESAVRAVPENKQRQRRAGLLPYGLFARSTGRPIGRGVRHVAERHARNHVRVRQQTG